MAKNYLLIHSEQLATDIELMCQSIKAPSNTLFQIRKSSSSVYANIREANYGQSIAAQPAVSMPLPVASSSRRRCRTRRQ